jgi:glycosyltransferase involved in cell wall biosynthesis
MGAVEAERLEATRDVASVRAELGVSAETPLIGVVARIQPHRRFDLLLAAMQRLVRERPDARLVLIGRGTHVDAVARLPARRLGLEEAVILAGYRVEDYGALLRALDVFCFLVPGSDGGCRALLEAATLGLPLVGSGRGAIPEIVRDGRTGLLVDEDPERLAGAWLELITHEERRRALGKAAALDARARFVPRRLAEDVEGFYSEVCADSCTPMRDCAVGARSRR